MHFARQKLGIGTFAALPIATRAGKFGLARDRTARRMIKHHHIARPASRTAQAALQPRQRKIPAPCPDQSLHVQVPAVAALAIRLVARAVAAFVVAADGDAPAQRMSVAYGLDRHRKRLELCY